MDRVVLVRLIPSYSPAAVNRRLSVVRDEGKTNVGVHLHLRRNGGPRISSRFTAARANARPSRLRLPDPVPFNSASARLFLPFAILTRNPDCDTCLQIASAGRKRCVYRCTRVEANTSRAFVSKDSSGVFYLPRRFSGLRLSLAGYPR